MIFIGIDPGKSGGIAVVSSDLEVEVFPIPLAGDEIDMHEIYVRLKKHCLGYKMAAYIEKVGAMPKQGVTSMFSFGFTTGALHAIIACLGIPRYVVTPQAWKKEILAGTAKDKAAAIDYCIKAYPGVNLYATDRSKVCHDGMADSLCIATYAMKQFPRS
jgi:crossover junction endodeoxyribonuclease RuvC